MAFWNDRTQSFALVRPNWPLDPDPEFCIGDRFAQCPTFDSLIGSLAHRGLRLVDDQSLVNLIDLNNKVTARFGVSEIVGFTSDEGLQRVGMLTPKESWVELNPTVGHQSHRIGWGDKSQNSLATAQLVLDCCVGPLGDARPDAYHLMISVLADVGEEWSMTAQAVADWRLDGETPTTTLLRERIPIIKADVQELERSPPPPRRGLERD